MCFKGIKLDCCNLNKSHQNFHMVPLCFCSDILAGGKQDVRHQKQCLRRAFVAQDAAKTLMQCSKKQSKRDENPASGYPDTKTVVLFCFCFILFSRLKPDSTLSKSMQMD